MDDTKVYPGCSPGWKPDEVLASRMADSVSIEDQIAREKARYAKERAAADPTVEVPEPKPSEVSEAEDDG